MSAESDPDLTQAELKRVDQSLQEFKTPLNRHAIVTITDTKGKITYVNDHFCEISQYEREESVGQDHRILNSGNHSREFFKELWETIQSGETWGGEIRNRRKDGSHYWMEMTIIPLLDDAGDPKQYIAIGADITQRRLFKQELDETRERLEHISEATNDVFWMLDASGKRMIYVSPAFEEIWGEKMKALYEDSQIWAKAIVAEDRSKYLRGFKNFRKGEYDIYDDTYRIRDAAGEICWIRDRGYVSRDDKGEVLCFSGVATDVTYWKALEAQVVEATEQERIRIGHDLHDDLCQRLAALKLACGSLATSLEGEESKKLREIETEMGEATALSRSLARGLSPVSLEEDGLMVALEQLAETIESRFGIPCQFDCPEPVAVSAPTCASHVFRIAQELSNNAAKHGKPSRITVGLHLQAGGFKLEVVNDGIPFHGPSVKERRMGLHFIRFRADAIGASLDFIPGEMPDGGTRVVCLVPQRGTKKSGS